jgi:hypothetical protein
VIQQRVFFFFPGKEKGRKERRKGEEEGGREEGREKGREGGREGGKKTEVSSGSSELLQASGLAQISWHDFYIDLVVLLPAKASKGDFWAFGALKKKGF